MMNLKEVLNELAVELQLVNEAIALFEQMACAQQPRRERPPERLSRIKRERSFGGEPTRQRLTDTLRRRFAEADAAYKSATHEYKYLMSTVKDSDAPSDGVQALRQAMKTQQQALRKYHHAISELSDFARPEEPPADSD